MKTKKITAGDRKQMKDVIAGLKPSEKDEVLADLILFAQRAIGILDELTKHSTLTAKEKKEIEDSITVGPKWLRYTRRVRQNK